MRVLPETTEDGLTVQRVDYSVVRVSILDMSDQTFQKFVKTVSRAALPQVAMHAKASVAYAQLRRKATTKGEEYKYINIAGGAAESLDGVMDWLRAQGLAAYAKVTPGPLLRATRGHLLTHMPFSKDSSYKTIIGAMRDAYEISKGMEEPDLEMDLAGREEPKWGHHSLRRGADRFARDSMAETGATKDDIDDLFGWKQRERALDMQLHYAGLRDRALRARVTMMI